jgi:hypothetical protein
MVAVRATTAGGGASLGKGVAARLLWWQRGGFSADGVLVVAAALRQKLLGRRALPTLLNKDGADALGAGCGCFGGQQRAPAGGIREGSKAVRPWVEPWPPQDLGPGQGHRARSSLDVLPSADRSPSVAKVAVGRRSPWFSSLCLQIWCRRQPWWLLVASIAGGAHSPDSPRGADGGEVVYHLGRGSVTYVISSVLQGQELGRRGGGPGRWESCLLAGEPVSGAGR